MTMAGPGERAAGRWRVLLGPCPLGRDRVDALRSALPSWVSCNAPYAPDRLAGEIVAGLAGGERVLLANGPWELGPTLGDPYIARAIALLPRGLPPGVVVGAFHHAHALTELTLRAPAVATYVAAPLAESLVAAGEHAVARQWRSIGELGTPTERLCELPSRAHVGYAQPPLRTRPARLPALRELAARTLRAGEAHGPLLGGNLLGLAFAIPRWPTTHLDGAILAIEIAGAQLRMIDRYLQRLALLGVFDRIGALLVGAPFDLVAERPALELDAIIVRAVGERSCAVVVDAFVGSGLPATNLRLGEPATVSAWPGGWRFVAPGPKAVPKPARVACAAARPSEIATIARAGSTAGTRA